MPQWAWLNGIFVAPTEAMISPFDRGFLFADGVYEVTAVYDGKLIDLERHLDRLERSLSELGFPDAPDRNELEEMHSGLVQRNKIREGLVYLQVTRGAYGNRDFVAPSQPRLTVWAFAESKTLIDSDRFEAGLKAILVPDIRWARRDIKSVGLLAQTLAKTEARRQGKDDAWFADADGFVTEAASANAWIVTQQGDLLTRPLSNDILPGITRHRLIDLLTSEGLSVVERAFTIEEAKSASEAFSTSAVALVAPVIELDGVRIGDGRPGPVTRKMAEVYYRSIGALT